MEHFSSPMLSSVLALLCSTAPEDKSLSFGLYIFETLYQPPPFFHLVSTKSIEYNA